MGGLEIGIDGGHGQMRTEIRMNESHFITISSPTFPATPPCMCAHTCMLLCAESCHMYSWMQFYKLWSKKKQFPSCALSHSALLSIPPLHVQSIKDAQHTLLAHKLSCIDFLKDVRLLRLVNMPLKDPLCSHIIVETPRIHTHLIAQMP